MSAQNPQRAAGLRLFLQSAAFDFLLALAASSALVFTISYGFESAPELRANVALELGLCACMLLPMYAGSWSKGSLAWAIPLTLLVAAGILVGFCIAMPPGTPLFADGAVNDAPENYVIFGLVVVAVPVVVFLLSRRAVGLFFLLLGAVMACGAVQFLYRDWASAQPGIPAFLLVMMAVCMMFVFQTYRSSLIHAKSAKRPAFLQVFGFAAGLSALCVGLGCLVFFGAINALGLSTPDVRPFTDYYERPVVEYTGVYTQQQVDNLDMLTSQLSDEWEDTIRQGEGGGEVNKPDQEISSDPLTGLAQALQAFDSSKWEEQFNIIGYQLLTPQGIAAVLLVVALLVVLVLFWRHRRVARLRKWRELSPEEEVMEVFDFLSSRFKRLKLRRPPNLTPLEHALATRKELAVFAKGTGGVDLFTVTLIYQRAFYGQAAVSREQLEMVERYYSAFFANARSYVGKVKWLWKFWRM